MPKNNYLKTLKFDHAAKFWDKKSEIFSSCFDPRNNSIGFMRTAFALLVIVNHTFPLGGYGHDPLFRFGQDQETLGGIAVKGFFILSGYLIAASYVRSHTTPRYFWHRFLRIMPAFWAALIVVAFFFAPLMYYLQKDTISGFTIHGLMSPLQYVWHNAYLYMNQYEISNLTANLPWPHAFNGSLWTLYYEVLAYVVIGFVGVFGLIKDRSKLVLGSVAVLYGLYILSQAVPGSIQKVAPFLADPQMLPLMLFFFSGTLWYLFRDKVVHSNKLAVFAIIILILALRYHFYALVSPILYTYLVFYFATALPFKGFDRKAAFSYGINIYAFPVQQLLAQLSLNTLGGPVLFATISALITLPFAVASFYLVEKPALKLKNIGLRRKK